MNLLVINCSPQRGHASTFCVVKNVLNQLSESHSIVEKNQAVKNKAWGDVVVAHFDATTLPHIDSEYALALSSVDDKNQASNGSLLISEQLIHSLKAADTVIITSPMHNYSVPSSLKSWVDHVVRVGETFNITPTGKQPLLADKPIYILISSGGVFSGEAAYQPDFFTPYMKEVLATIGLDSVYFLTIEGTSSDNESVQQRIGDVQAQLYQYLYKDLI